MKRTSFAAVVVGGLFIATAACMRQEGLPQTEERQAVATQGEPPDEADAPETISSEDIGVADLASLADILAKAAFNEGVKAWNSGRIDDAITHWRHALRADPNMAEAYSNLGVAYARKGEMDKATEALCKAIRLNPELSEARQNLSIILEATLGKQKAMEELEALTNLIKKQKELEKELEDLENLTNKLKPKPQEEQEDETEPQPNP